MAERLLWEQEAAGSNPVTPIRRARSSRALYIRGDLAKPRCGDTQRRLEWIPEEGSDEEISRPDLRQTRN